MYAKQTNIDAIIQDFTVVLNCRIGGFKLNWDWGTNKKIDSNLVSLRMRWSDLLIVFSILISLALVIS
jgi:hypothetical protein